MDDLKRFFTTVTESTEDKQEQIFEEIPIQFKYWYERQMFARLSRPAHSSSLLDIAPLSGPTNEEFFSWYYIYTN